MPLLNQFQTPIFGIFYDESAWQAQSVGEGSHTASRRFQVEGALAGLFVQEVLGWTTYDAGGARLNRRPPWKHPRFPWLNAKSAQFVRETGTNLATGPGNTLEFECEEWEFTYQADDDRLVRWLGDDQRPAGTPGEAWRYVNRKVELQIASQPLPMGALLYNKLEAGTNKAVPDSATGQLVPSRSLWMTWYQVPVTLNAAGYPELPGRLQQTIDETVGRMNGTPFEGRSPQTLLMLDPKYSYKNMSNGEPCCDLLYSFTQRGGPDVSAVGLMTTDTPTGDFTRIIRAASGLYGRVYRKDDDVAKVKSIYEPADFNRLFEFD